MKRDIEAILDTWKKDNHRLPLLLKGARQVGKSYTVTEFGRKAFNEQAIINFEQNPEYKACFATLTLEAYVVCIFILKNISHQKV